MGKMRFLVLCLAALTGWAGLLSSRAADTTNTNVPANEAGTSGASPAADAVAQKFLEACAGCHSIGGGKMMGPDLKDAAGWSKADLKPAIKRMEQRVGPLSDQDIEEFADFIKDPQAPLRLKNAETAVAQVATANLEPASAAIGRELFFGSRPLANGGMACTHCHQVNGVGGLLGLDLTTVKNRIGETALSSAIQKANFKIMSSAYKNHPVTPQEALHIGKYLSTLNQAVAVPRRSPVWPLGTGFTALFLVGLGLVSHKNHFGRRKPLRPRRS